MTTSYATLWKISMHGLHLLCL